MEITMRELAITRRLKNYHTRISNHITHWQKKKKKKVINREKDYSGGMPRNLDHLLRIRNHCVRKRNNDMRMINHHLRISISFLGASERKSVSSSRRITQNSGPVKFRGRTGAFDFPQLHHRLDWWSLWSIWPRRISNLTGRLAGLTNKQGFL